MNILIAGVGGQGTILASKIISTAAMLKGLFVSTAETIGMSQRGGCVVSHIRIGEQGLGSVIPFGRADLIIGFEPAETLRNIRRLKKEGVCIVNTHPVIPHTVSILGQEYDIEKINTAIAENTNRAIFVDLYEDLKSGGFLKALNVALLGAAFKEGLLDFKREHITKAITENVKPAYLDMNLSVFDKFGGCYG